MNRLPLLLLFTLPILAVAPGCFGSKKPKPNPNIAAETEESFRQRWVARRIAELQAGPDAPDGRKAREMAANHRVALLIYWAEISRQVRITGQASRVSTAESLRYFLSRPRDSQIGAWVSDQSRVIEGRQLLEAKFAEMKGRFAAGDVPLPSFWGGYRVGIEAVEFWQARENRLHDRFVYRRDRAGWTIERLAP